MVAKFVQLGVRQALVPVTKHAATMARTDEEKCRTAVRLPQTITQLAVALSCTTGGSLPRLEAAY